MPRKLLLAWVIATLALTGCATQKTAVRNLAAQKLACPEDAIQITKEDRRIYSATGCGLTVRIACHDPYDSTGAARGWGDPLTAGNRAECEDIIDRPAAPPVSKTTTTSAQTTSAFDRDLAAKLLSAAADRARTCGVANAPAARGEGHARVTFVNDGTVASVEVDSPFTDTEPGRCVEREMKRVSLPRFEGSAVTVKKAFRID